MSKPVITIAGPRPLVNDLRTMTPKQALALACLLIDFEIEQARSTGNNRMWVVELLRAKRILAEIVPADCGGPVMKVTKS